MLLNMFNEETIVKDYGSALFFQLAENYYLMDALIKEQILNYFYSSNIVAIRVSLANEPGDLNSE